MTRKDNHPDFPIDWNDLFYRIGDEEIIVEFASSFLKNSEKIMGLLEDAVSDGDAEQIELYAHTLKGTASNIGAIALAKVAWQLEKATSEKHVETAVEWLEEIKPRFEALITLLRQPDWVEQAKHALLAGTP